MELKEALPVLPNRKKYSIRRKWERRAFVHAHRMGNTLISGADTNSYTPVSTSSEIQPVTISRRPTEKLGGRGIGICFTRSNILGLLPPSEKPKRLLACFGGYP